MYAVKALVILDDGTRALESAEQPMPNVALTTRGDTVADWRAA